MNILKRSLFILGFSIFTMGLFAQSVEDAGAKYNEGNTAMKEKKYSSAVASYEEALKIASSAMDAEELKGNIETQLMAAYYKQGVSIYKKDLDGAISILEKGYAFASELGDSKYIKKYKSTIAQIRTKKGDALTEEKKLEEAYAEYEMALKLKPNYPKSLYGQGKVYKEKGDLEMMMEKMDLVIKYGADNPKMAKTIKNAKNVAATALYNEAQFEIQKEHGKKAVELLNNTMKYSTANADTYSSLAKAYNQTKQFNEAITSAKKALEMTEGDKSGIYFQLGKALEGSGDTTGACDAYKKVTTGPNVEAAKYQITQTLKCG